MNAVVGLIVLFALLFVPPLSASDQAKEKRWADQIVDGLIDGEAVWLSAGEQGFLAIYTEAAESPPKGGVILLHGIGAHPDWPQVIHPLRVGLAEDGWATLSVQMPVLPNEAASIDYIPLFDEVDPRIDAAIGFLQDRDIRDIVVVGHSLGASMADHYLRKPRRGVKGFVAIGLATDANMRSAVSLRGITVPVLDLYGGQDQRDVRDTAAQRAAEARADQKGAYTRKEVEGANHFFDGREEVLVDTVEQWIEGLK